MAQYENFARNILNTGKKSDDRTGTGTVRSTGGTLRYSLSEGFPIVTTKKVSLGFILKELAWFLEGSTSQKVLKESYGCSIWDEWADEHGRLGPVYGAQWVRRPAAKIEIVKIPVNTEVGLIISPADGEKMIASNFRRHGGKKIESNPVWPIWRRLVTAVSMKHIGKFSNDIPITLQARSLQKEWSDFRNFERDFYSLPGNEITACGDTSSWTFHTPNFNHGIYSKNTLVFIETYKDALVRTAMTQTLLELHDKGITDWVYAPKFYINQLAEAIHQIKTSPNSRRILVDAWEPSMLPMDGVAPNKQAALGRMALAPCHYNFQFLVMPAQKKGERATLDMVFNMRSIDTSLGLPYNIASYAALLHLVALECDLNAGDLVFSGADCHVYANHIKTLRTQIRRKDHPLPELVIDPSVKCLADFKPHLLTLKNYTHGPVTNYPVAV